MKDIRWWRMFFFFKILVANISFLQLAKKHARIVFCVNRMLRLY